MLDRVEGKGAAESERCRPEQSIAIFHGSRNVLRELHAGGQHRLVEGETTRFLCREHL
jgi:hypothetical protein